VFVGVHETCCGERRGVCVYMSFVCEWMFVLVGERCSKGRKMSCMGME